MIINPYAFGRTKPLNWIGTYTGDTGAGNYSMTIPGVSFGPSGTKRLWTMVSWLGVYGTTQMSSMTIDGGAATRERRVNTSSNTRNLESWYRNTSASSGALTLAFTQHTVTCRVSVWWAGNTAPTTDTDASLASAGSRSGTVATYAGGCVMAGAYWSQSGRTTTWTNATELEDSTGLHSFAMVDETTAGSRTVTAALSSASASFNFLLVSAS